MKNLPAVAVRAIIACLLLCPVLAAQAPRTYDYTATDEAVLSGTTRKWTYQVPTAATVTARVKLITLDTIGGSGNCSFTVFRNGTLATATTLVVPTPVSSKIVKATVPAPQGRMYAASNSTGGTQVGKVYRLDSSFDALGIPYDALYLSAGDSVTVVADTCTTTAQVMFVAEEF